MTRTGRLLTAGAISGAVWLLIAIAFDKGVRDFNVPVIPSSTPSEIVVSLIAALLAGVIVAVAFSRAWGTSSRILFFLAPVGALAVGVLAFGVLIWTLGKAAGAATERLDVTVTTLSLYAMLSAFTPILYAFALINSLAMRRLVHRAA
jgi:hypothetical protein